MKVAIGSGLVAAKAELEEAKHELRSELAINLGSARQAFVSSIGDKTNQFDSATAEMVNQIN